MAALSKSGDRGARTVTVTFEDRSDKDLLERLARERGVSPSALARELLLKSLHSDAVLESLVAIEERLEAIQRNVRVGPWLVLKAMEYREQGQEVPDANGWVEEKMPATGPAPRR